MSMSVAEASQALNVSKRRVIALIHQGEIRARQVGGIWLIDPAGLGRKSLTSRPMAPKNAWALILDDSSWLSPQDAWKLRKRVARLKDHPHPDQVLASWLKNRAVRLELSAPSPAELLGDNKAVPSGVSDKRSGMASLNFVEMYVHEDDFESFKYDHMLVESSRPNVVLHVCPVEVPSPVPIRLLIADLFEHPGAREQAQAEVLAQEVSW